MTTQRIGPFRGLWSALGGEAPAGYASSLLNVRLTDGAIRPRFGFERLAAAPANLRAVHGFFRLSGYSDGYAHREEWVSVENRGGFTAPYSVDPTTWARTPIKAGSLALATRTGDWLGFGYNGLGYFVNPGGTPNVYRHEVGNPASWSAIQSTTYTPTVADPTIKVDLGTKLDTRPWTSGGTGGDAWSNPSGGRFVKGPISYAVNPDGALVVTGTADNQGAGNVGNATFRVVFSAPVDLSGLDYVAFKIDGGYLLLDGGFFSAGSSVRIRVGSGGFVAPVQRETISDDKQSVALVVRLTEGTSYTNVTGMEFYVKAYPRRIGEGKTAIAIQPLAYGGTYLGAPIQGAHAWDLNPNKPDVTYGVRYRKLSAPTETTGIKTITLAGSRFGLLSYGHSAPVGDIVNVEASPNLQAPFVDDPAGTAFVMDVVRRDADGKYRILATLPNTTGQVYREGYELRELAGLVEATGSAYVTPSPATVFPASGFVGATPYKGWVVWFSRGGKGNVQHSRVGNAEALTSPGDDVADEGRGQTFTLADDFADEPWGGVQAGDALLIAGREGVYGQSGNSPSEMTPPRKLPGSMGCVGRFAFARFRDEAGNYGIAWLDAAGEAVWFASASLSYSLDTQARPAEISLPIRGTLRRFLLDEPRATTPGLALERARMDVDEATGSLWVVLGNRAAVLRPPSPLDGSRHWELYDYALGSYTVGEPAPANAGAAPGLETNPTTRLDTDKDGIADEDDPYPNDPGNGGNPGAGGGGTGGTVSSPNPGGGGSSNPDPYPDPTSGTYADAIAYLAFSPDRKLVWLRASGEIDAVDWSPGTAGPIEGTNRDGGAAMPSGHWESARLGGPTRRLARAEAERDGFTPLDFAASTERVPQGVAAGAPQGRRWARWGIPIQGRTHRLRVTIDETTIGVRALDLVFQAVGGPGR